jgi:hypothetical protein
VADDATATYWNPAGLASIPLFDLSLSVAERRAWDDSSDPSGTPAWRTRNSGIVFALPVVGISYVRLRGSEVRYAPTGQDGSVRDDGNTTFRGGAATTTHLGVTVVQSLGDIVVVGTTLRLVRGSAAAATLQAPSARAALDAADDLDGPGETQFDADLGAMVYLGRARIGLTVRNLVAPDWDDTGLLLDSERLARIGVAWGPGPVRGRRSWTIAADADLTSAAAAGGERRSVAVGVERWFRQGRVALRGGARAQTIGDARPAATGGASLGIWSGLLVEAQVTAGGEADERGWGLGARVTF